MATSTHRPRAADGTRHAGLQRLLDQQEAMLQSRRHTLREALPTWTTGVVDVEEHALDAEGQGIGFSVLELTSRTVQGIEAALQRLEAGSYGSCFDCRGPISSARLRAMPFAALCLACQQRQDTHGSASTASGSREN